MSREKNRQREHESHGWREGKALVQKPDEIFVECPCGWCGWISKGF